MFCEIVDNYTNQLQEVYDSVCKKLPEFEKYTFDQFMESKILLSSRLFGAQIDEQESGIMVPFADMLNHS